MKKKLLMIILAATLAFGIIPPQESVVIAASGTGEIVSSVNFRTGPSTSNSRIRYLQKGEKVDILEKVNAYWYKVRDRNGRVGYVSTNSKYIKVTSSSASNSSSANATIVSGVNFRTGPSTSSSKIRLLKKGEKVTILSQVNSYWYEVRDRNGRVGYVSTNSKYISTNYNGHSGSSSGNTAATINRVIAAGKKYLGTPYEFGSNRSSTKTFDCSAFVRRAFIDGAGITLPSNSRTQGDYVKKKGNTTTNWRNLKVGDLMFFMAYKGTSKSAYSNVNKSKERIAHVGIYLGNGQILHTYSKESGGVRIDNIAGRHWEYRFLFGGSAL